jgi:hypothetical protein
MKDNVLQQITPRLADSILQFVCALACPFRTAYSHVRVENSLTKFKQEGYIQVNQVAMVYQRLPDKSYCAGRMAGACLTVVIFVLYMDVI